ncbi:MAG: MFS transporter [Ekhidna sp.]
MLVLLVLILFTVVVDYMLLPALSVILIDKLSLSSEAFGTVASAYGFSAAISSFLAIGFMDRFERKKILLIFFAGFVFGLICCVLSQNYYLLLASRVITGISGGLVGATCLTIVADLFQANQRGKVMGFIQMAYATGQIGGVPLAMYLASQFSWQVSYLFIIAIGIVSLGLLIRIMERLSDHLALSSEERPLIHAIKTVGKKRYWFVFGNSLFVVLGDMTLMTFNTVYLTKNLGLSLDQIPLIYVAIGAIGIAFGPLWGKIADQLGKVKVFTIGSILSMISLICYTQMEFYDFWVVLMLHIVLFIGINARMVASTSLGMSIPEPADRGTFMAFDASLQQAAAGLASMIAGYLVITSESGALINFHIIGLIVCTLMFITILMMWRINQLATH